MRHSAAIVTLFLAAGGAPLAAQSGDIAATPAPGQGFAVSDASGTVVRLRVGEDGVVVIPSLPAALVREEYVCFDGASGQLGRCPPLSGASGAAGPAGAAGSGGSEGPTGPTGPDGPEGLVGPPGDRGQYGPRGPLGDFTLLTVTTISNSEICPGSCKIYVEVVVPCPPPFFPVALVNCFNPGLASVNADVMPSPHGPPEFGCVYTGFYNSGETYTLGASVLCMTFEPVMLN